MSGSEYDDTGVGRKRTLQSVRDALLYWYDIVRHSVDVKIMCRFPKQVLLTKAQELHKEYLIVCFRKDLKPDKVDITEQWINDWLVKHSAYPTKTKPKVESVTSHPRGAARDLLEKYLQANEIRATGEGVSTRHAEHRPEPFSQERGR